MSISRARFSRHALVSTSGTSPRENVSATSRAMTSAERVPSHNSKTTAADGLND